MNASGAPATNRLASDGNGFNYTYDAAGNQTNAPGYTYAYDGANRLKTVNGAAASYGYDGDGMKSRQTSGGNAIFYVRSSVLGNVAMEVNATAGVYRAYVYAGGKLAAQRSYDGQFYWMHQDHLGSGRKMTDATGAVKYRAEFDPYGQLVLSWSASGYDNLNSRRFTGYERDTASGLDYANARMYSASGAGRFMQADPIGLKGAELRRPQSLNTYAYAGNDPVNFIDQTGLHASPYEPGEFALLDHFWRMGMLGHVGVSGGQIESGGGTASNTIGFTLPEDYVAALDNALAGLIAGLYGLSDTCRENVINRLTGAGIGFTLESFRSYLEGGANFYDGNRAFIPIAGNVTTQQAFNAGRATGLFKADTIGGQFLLSPGLNAMASITTPRLTIYFRNRNDVNGNPVIDVSNNGLNSHNIALLFHEALHGFTGRGDSDLQDALGLSNSASNNITQYLANNCNQ